MLLAKILGIEFDSAVSHRTIVPTIFAVSCYQFISLL